MNLEIPIDKETLNALYEALPSGAIGEIAKRTKYSGSYVSQFFKGSYNVTEENSVIIDEAKKIINEQLKRASDIAKGIHETAQKINNKK